MRFAARGRSESQESIVIQEVEDEDSKRED
jgi:hypothetical protein